MRTPHPAAELFPLMEGDEYAALVEDIRTNGLQESIWIDKQGRVLDGRNRERACKDTGRIPSFRTYEGNDPIGFVLSLNLHRRHLNASQRAVLALSVERMEAEEAKVRQAKAGAKAAPGRPAEKGTAIVPEVSGESRERAARATGASARYVSEAKAIATQAPDLLPEITAGTKTIPEAKREVKARQEDLKERIVEKSNPALNFIVKFDKALGAWADKIAPFDPVEVVDAFVSDGQADRITEFMGELRRYADRLDAALKEATKLRGVN